MKSKILVTSENDLVKIYTADFLEKEKQRCEMDRPVADFRILIHKSADENHNLHNRFLQDLTNMFLMKERTFNNKNNEDSMRYKLIGSLSSKRIKPVEQEPGNTDHITNKDRENYILLKKETELFLKRETESGKVKFSTETIEKPKLINEVNTQKSQIKHVSGDDEGFTYKFVETKSENRSSVQVRQSVHSYTINKQTVSKQIHNKKTVIQQLITKQQKEHVTQSKSMIQIESPMTQCSVSPTNISEQTKSDQTQITKTIIRDSLTEPPNVEISYLQNVKNTEPIINQIQQPEMNSAPIKIQNISQESNIKSRDDFILLKETVQRFLDNHKNHNDVEQQAFANFQSSKFIKPQSDKQQSKVEMGVVSKSTKNPKKGIIGKIKNFIGLKSDKHSKTNQVNFKVTRDTCESFLKHEKEYSDSDILTTLGFREPSKEIDSVTIFGFATEKKQTLPVRIKSIENLKSESDLKGNQNAPEKESKLKTILGIPKVKPSKKASGEKVIIPSETDDFGVFNTIRPNKHVESEKCLETASEEKILPQSVFPTNEKIPKVSEASDLNSIHISTNSPQMQTPKPESNNIPKQSSVKKTQFHPFGKIRTKSQSKDDFEELKKQTDKFLLVQKNYSDLEKEAHEVFKNDQMNTVKRRKPPPVVARVTPFNNLKAQNEEEMYEYWRNQTKLFLDNEKKCSDAYGPKPVSEKILEKEENLKLNSNISKSPNMQYEKQVSEHIEPVQEYQLPSLSISEDMEIKRRLLKRIHLDSQNIHRMENFEYLNSQTNKLLINERKYSSYERDFYENLYKPRQSAIEENIENKEISKVDTEKPKPVESKVGVLKRLKSLVHINGEKSAKNVNSKDQHQQLKSNLTQFLINEKKYSDTELGAYYNFLQKRKISLNESYVIEYIEPIRQLPITEQIVATKTEIIKNPPKKHIDSTPKKLTEKENYIYLNTQTNKFLINERKYSDFLGDFYENFYRPKTAVLEGNIEKKVDVKVGNEKQKLIDSGSGMLSKLKNIVHISEKSPKKMDSKHNFEKLKSETNQFLIKEKKYNNIEREAYQIFLTKFNIPVVQNKAMENRKPIQESLVSKQTIEENLGMKKQIHSNLKKENPKEKYEDLNMQTNKFLTIEKNHSDFSGDFYEKLYRPKTTVLEKNSIENKVDMKGSNEKQKPVDSESGILSKLKNIIHISGKSPKKMDSKDVFKQLKLDTNHFLIEEKKYNDIEGEAYQIFLRKFDIPIVQNKAKKNRKPVQESLVSKQTVGENLGMKNLDGKKQIHSNSKKENPKEKYEHLSMQTNKFLTIEKKYSDFSGDFYEKLYRPKTTILEKTSIENKVDMKGSNEKEKPVDSESGILSKLKNIIHISGKSPKKMDSKDVFKQLKLDTNHFLIEEKKHNDIEGEAYQIFLRKFNIPVVQNKAMENRKPAQESLISKQTVGENLGMKNLDGKKQIHSNSKKENPKEKYEHLNMQTNKFLSIEKKYSDFSGDFYEKLYRPKTTVLEKTSIENKVDMKGSNEKEKPVDSESGILSKLKNIIHITGKSPKKMDSKGNFKQLKLDTNHFLIEEQKYNDLEGEAYQNFLKKFNIPVVQNKAMENRKPVQESLVSKQTVGKNLGMKELDGKNSKKENPKEKYEYLNMQTNKLLIFERKHSNFSGDFYENLYKPKTAVIEGNIENRELLNVSNEKQKPADAGNGILSKLKNIVHIRGKSPTKVNSKDNFEQVISDTHEFLIDQRKYDDIEKEAHYKFMEKYKINLNGNKISEVRSIEQTPIIKENVTENLKIRKNVLKDDNGSKHKKGNEPENYEYLNYQTKEFLSIERKYNDYMGDISEKSPHIAVIEKNIVQTEEPNLSSANQKPSEVKTGFFSKLKNIGKVDTVKSPQKADWYDDNIYLSAQTDAFLVKERTYNNLYKEAYEHFLDLSKKNQTGTMPSRENVSENIETGVNESLLMSGVSKSPQNKEANKKNILTENILITSPTDVLLGNEKKYYDSQGRELENCKLMKSIPIEIPVTQKNYSEANSPNAESPPKDHKNIKQKTLSKLKTIIGRSDDKSDKKPKTSESEFVRNLSNSFLLNEKRFYDYEKQHHQDLEPKNMKGNLQPLQNKIVADGNKQKFELDKSLTSQFMHDFKRHSDLEKEDIEKCKNKFNESSKERNKEPVLTKFKNIIGLGKENTTKRKQKESYEILKLQTEKFISNHKQHHDLERQAHHNLKKPLLFSNAERIQTVDVTDLGTSIKENIPTESKPKRPNAIIEKSKENHEFDKKATNKFLENEKNSWDFQRDNYETYKLVNTVVRAENKGNVIKVTNPIATSSMISKKPSMDGSKDAKIFTHIRDHTNDFLMREKAFSDLQMGDYHNYKTIIYVNNNINEMPRRDILQGNRDQTPVYGEEPKITRNEESSTVREDAKNAEETPFEASLVESVQTIPVLTQNANTSDAQNKPQPKKRTIKETIVPKLKSLVPHKKNQKNEEAKVLQQVKDDIQRFLHMERQIYALEHPGVKNSKLAMNPEANDVEKRIYPVGDHGETEAAGKKSNRKDVASPDKMDKHSKTKHRLLPKLPQIFGKSSAKSKTSDENFALSRLQTHEFLMSERKCADSELKNALKFPKSPKIVKKREENVTISVRTPVMNQQQTSRKDQRERQQNFEHLKAETISFLLSQKDYSDFEREGMEKYRLTTVAKIGTSPEKSTRGQSPSKKKEPNAHRKVFSKLKNFATGADKLSQKHQDREHLEFLKKITNDFLISQKDYSDLELKASEKFRKRQITYAPTPTKMKFAHKDSLKLVNATPVDRERHNTQPSIGSNQQLQPVKAKQKFVTTSNEHHSELQMQTAKPVPYIPVPHKKEEVIKLKQVSNVDLQKSSSKSAANANAKSALKNLGNNTNLGYNISKEKEHSISKTETEVFLENQKLYSDAQKEEYVKFRTAEILESRNLVKDPKKIDLMKPVTLLLNTNTFLLNEKKYGHSEKLNENIFNRRKSPSTEKIVERRTFNKKTVPKINTTMSQLLSKDPVRISEMSQDWTAVFLENERNHGLPLRKENQTEAGRLSSNSSTSLQGNRPKNEIQNLIRKTNKEIMLDSPDSQVTETRIYCDGLTTSRYITKCYIEPVSTPVWYTESLLLDIETKQQKTDEKIYYENKFRPHYWSEIFITNISPKTDVCLAEASFPMEKSDVHYISLEPQQARAIDIGIN